MRAYQMVRPDSPDLERDALASGADALILDCRNGHRPGPALHRLVDDARAQPRRPAILARIGPIEHAAIGGELAQAMSVAPEAVMLAVTHGRDVEHLAARLAVHEAEAGLPDGATRIIALLACAAAILNAPSVVGASPRLLALGWEAEAIADELGSAPHPDGDAWPRPLGYARAQTRLTAAAAGVVAIEAGFDGSDEAGFRRHLSAARRDGFQAIVTRDAAQTALAVR